MSEYNESGGFADDGLDNEGMYDDAGVSSYCIGYGHTEVVIYEDDEVIQYECSVCGAELEDTTLR